MLAVLEQFENAPATGPNEAPMPVRPVPDATNLVGLALPGKGLANILSLLRRRQQRSVCRESRARGLDLYLSERRRDR